MKKITLIVLLVAGMNVLQAQSDLFIKIKKAIVENYPDVTIENKLIAVNFWSTSNEQSREVNKQFNKAYKIYEFAKLKGGSKGLVAVAINNEGAATATILNKDGATKLITLNSIDISTTNEFTNVVFDYQGNEVYKNTLPEKIAESINKLITR